VRAMRSSRLKLYTPIINSERKRVGQQCKLCAVVLMQGNHKHVKNSKGGRNHTYLCICDV